MKRLNGVSDTDKIKAALFLAAFFAMIGLVVVLTSGK